MKKLLCITIILAMLLSIAAGCGSGGNNAGEAPAPAAPAEPALDNQADAPAADTAADGIDPNQSYDVVFWHHESPVHRVEAFQRVIDLFVEQHPNVTLRQEVVGWGETHARVFASAESGTLPDFQFGIPDLMITFYNAGIVLPVTDIVKEIDEKYTIYPDILGMYYHDGEYWSLPVMTMPFSFAYRPSILQQFGYDTPPQTWDELLAMSADITARGNGDVFGIGLGGGRNLFVDEQIYMFMASRGVKIFNENGSVNFNTPEMVEVMRYYNDLYQHSPVGSEAWMWGEIEMNLAAGVVAMAPYLSSIQIRMNEMDSDDLGFAHMPLYQEGFTRGTLTYPNNVAVFRDTVGRGNLPVVNEFMRFIMQPEINEHLTSGMEPGGFIPCTEAAAAYSGYWNSPIIQRYLTVNQTAVETLEYASLYGFEYGHWVNNGIGDIVGGNLISASMSRVLTGESTPEDAAAWGAEEMEKVSLPLG